MLFLLKFVEINKAHTILSNETKRQIYDQYGSLGLEISENLGDDNFNAYYEKTSCCWKTVVILSCLLTCCCCCLCCCMCCGKCKQPDYDDDDNVSNFLLYLIQYSFFI